MRDNWPREMYWPMVQECRNSQWKDPPSSSRSIPFVEGDLGKVI